MSESLVKLTITLEVATKREGRKWLAWCPSIDVMTQATTEQRARLSLREAIELWFESCISRGVLEKALREAGFRKVEPGQSPSTGAGTVQLHQLDATNASFRGKRDYLEISVPAYIAAQ